MKFIIDDMRRDDWRQVRDICREGLSSGLAAFTLSPPTWRVWDSGHLALGRFVARVSATQLISAGNVVLSDA